MSSLSAGRSSQGAAGQGRAGRAAPRLRPENLADSRRRPPPRTLCVEPAPEAMQGSQLRADEVTHAPASPHPLTRDEVAAFLAVEFPQMQIGRIFTIEAVGPMSARLRMAYHPSQLRPGGTLSGPTIFALADVALYVAILGQIGRVKHAVTTNLNINFLSRPMPARSSRRSALGQARQAPRRRRGAHLVGRRRGAGRSRDGDLFAAAARRERGYGIIIPHHESPGFSGLPPGLGFGFAIGR